MRRRDIRDSLTHYTRPHSAKNLMLLKRSLLLPDLFQKFAPMNLHIGIALETESNLVRAAHILDSHNQLAVVVASGDRDNCFLSGSSLKD